MLTTDRPSANPLLPFLLSLVALPYVGLAQQPSSEPDRAALQSFTAEIHQLRIAIEQTLSVLPRLQLVLTKFQMQQARVDRLNEEFQNFRMQLDASVANKDQMEKTLNQLESQTASIDPGQRTAFEERKKLFKLQLDEQTANVQEQRSKEVELSTQLQKERGLLCDVTAQLDAIEKMLQHVR